MKNNLYEGVVIVILIVLAVAILNPMHFWMPDMMHESMLIVLLALFAGFAAFVMRERTGDERENMLRMFSGCVGYLAGATVLVVAIALQGFHGAADPWLIFALLAMLGGKLGARILTERS